MSIYIRFFKSKRLQSKGTGRCSMRRVIYSNNPVWAYFRELSCKEVFAAATTNYKEEVLFTVN